MWILHKVFKNSHGLGEADHGSREDWSVNEATDFVKRDICSYLIVQHQPLGAVGFRRRFGIWNLGFEI